jgi:kynurenine formamidase
VADPGITAAEFRSLYDRLRDRARWGPQDRRGALNNVAPADAAAAAGEVRTGRTVSLAAPVEHEAGPDNPDPWEHELTDPPGLDPPPDGLAFALDRMSLHVHGDADSHIDALCHVIFDGTLYGGLAASDALASAGIGGLSIAEDGQGIAGRGVLLDIPRVRGTDWLEPGDHVTADDLTAAEEAQHVRVGRGDLLFVRVGHRRRRRTLGAWDAASARAGLHPQAVPWLADRQVAVLGSDGNNDTAPSIVAGVDFPVHVLAIRGLGLQLLDYLQLSDLLVACEAAARWSFLCVIAPLRLPRGTGSPVNPIAIF